jgi:hypothetical protein
MVAAKTANDMNKYLFIFLSPSSYYSITAVRLADEYGKIHRIFFTIEVFSSRAQNADPEHKFNVYNMLGNH